MPSDEQLREQFDDFLSSWFDEHDRAMLNPKELARAKAAFEAGHRSRDAEVQALREVLTEIEAYDWPEFDEDKPAVSAWEAVKALLRIQRIAAAALAGEGGDEQ